jgi:hypothetical protein
LHIPVLSSFLPSCVDLSDFACVTFRSNMLFVVEKVPDRSDGKKPAQKKGAQGRCFRCGWCEGRRAHVR